MSNNEANSTKPKGLRVKTNLKAGIGMCGKGRICQPADPNHNQTVVQAANVLRVTTSIKAGVFLTGRNHNQTIASAPKGLRVKTNLKAGLGMCGKGRICQPADPNHNQTLSRA